MAGARASRGGGDGEGVTPVAESARVEKAVASKGSVNPADGAKQDAKTWQAAENRRLTLEERAQLKNLPPLNVALNDRDAVLDTVRSVARKSDNQITRDERVRRIERARKDVEYARSMLDDRDELEQAFADDVDDDERNLNEELYAVERAALATLSPEAWDEIQNVHDRARRELNALESIPSKPTHKEVCWARTHRQIAGGILDADQLSDCRAVQQALGTASKSDLDLFAWSRERLARELITAMWHLVLQSELTSEQLARQAVLLCEPVNRAWLATSSPARPLLGHDWRARMGDVQCALDRWERQIRPEADEDIEQLTKAILRALGASNPDVQALFRIDYHRGNMRRRRRASSTTKYQRRSVAV